jgi:hypothetical protein
MGKPGWIERSEEAADIALGSAQVAQQAVVEVLDALPTPDPRDDVSVRRRRCKASARRHAIRADGQSLGCMSVTGCSSPGS